MPIYEYRCESCGAELEKLQKVSDPPLLECPECGTPALVKLVSASSFRLKGSGWYESDFKTGKKKNGLADASEMSGADTTGKQGGEERGKEGSKEGSKKADQDGNKAATAGDSGTASDKQAKPAPGAKSGSGVNPPPGKTGNSPAP